MSKKANEEEKKRGKREVGGEKGRGFAPASVPVVTGPFSPANVVCDVVVSDSDCEFVEPQRKREASAALERGTEMNVEGPPFKTMPESVRNRPTPQRSPFKAGPECLRNRRPPPPEGTPLQQTAARWPGPPKGPPVEVEEMEVEDANPPRNARERSASWSTSCSILKMKRFASSPSHSTRATKEGTASSQ